MKLASIPWGFAEVQRDPNIQKGQNVTPPVYTIEEFKKTYKLGHTKTFEEISSGRLQTYNVGRRRYISGRAAEAWQRSYEEQASSAKAPVA